MEFLSIPDLAAALAEAQGKIENATKDSTNPAFKSKYADLTAVIDAVRPALNSCGITILQRYVPSDPNTVQIETVLLHKTGQSLSSMSPMIPIPKHDAQGYGSASTYARRYCLQALLCVGADSDDDGNAASAPQPPQRGQQGYQQRPQQAPRQGQVAPTPQEKASARPVTPQFEAYIKFARNAEEKGYTVRGEDGKIKEPLVRTVLLESQEIINGFESKKDALFNQPLDKFLVEFWERSQELLLPFHHEVEGAEETFIDPFDGK